MSNGIEQGRKELDARAQSVGLVLPETTSATSRHALLRVAIEGFLDDVPAEELSDEVRVAMMDTDYFPPHYESYRFQFNMKGVDFTQSPYVPIDPIKLGKEIYRMNAPKMWEGLLGKAFDRDPNHRLRFTAAFPQKPPGMLLPDTADVIANNNAHFFAAHTTYLAFGAAYGPAYSDIAILRMVDGTTPFGGYEAGLEVARNYTSPAADPAELIERLRDVFPQEPLRGNGAKGVRILKGTRSFSRTHKDLGVISCPGTDITSRIYLEYGKLLNDPEYQAKFTEAL